MKQPTMMQPLKIIRRTLNMFSKQVSSTDQIATPPAPLIRTVITDDSITDRHEKCFKLVVVESMKTPSEKKRSYIKVVSEWSPRVIDGQCHYPPELLPFIPPAETENDK